MGGGISKNDNHALGFRKRNKIYKNQGNIQNNIGRWLVEKIDILVDPIYIKVLQNNSHPRLLIAETLYLSF